MISRLKLVPHRIVLIMFAFSLTSSAFGQQMTLCAPSIVKKANKYFDEATDARKKHKDYKEVKEYWEKT